MSFELTPADVAELKLWHIADPPERSIAELNLECDLIRARIQIEDLLRERTEMERSRDAERRVLVLEARKQRRHKLYALWAGSVVAFLFFVVEVTRWAVQ